VAQDNLLIAFTDLQSIAGQFSSNVTAAQVDPYIREAQTGEIRRFLGDELYLALLLAPTEARFVLLLEGEDYTNLNGIVVRFNGLEEAIKYWTLYRYVRSTDILMLKFGNRVAEDGIYSIGATREQVKATVYNQKNQALKYQTDADDYIRANIAVYPEFNSNTRIPKRASFELNKLPQGSRGHRHFFPTDDHLLNRR